MLLVGYTERAAKLTYISYNWKLLNYDETKLKKPELDLMNTENTMQENIEHKNVQCEDYNIEDDNLSISSHNSNSGCETTESDSD